MAVAESAKALLLRGKKYENRKIPGLPNCLENLKKAVTRDFSFPLQLKIFSEEKSCIKKLSNLFKKDGPLPDSLCLIFVFSFKILSSQQDSNSDHRSRRWGLWPLDHHHDLNLFFIRQIEPLAAEQYDTRGRNFLHTAILKDDLESVLFLLSIHVNVHSRWVQSGISIVWRETGSARAYRKWDSILVVPFDWLGTDRFGVKHWNLI